MGNKEWEFVERVEKWDQALEKSDKNKASFIKIGKRVNIPIIQCQKGVFMYKKYKSTPNEL